MGATLKRLEGSGLVLRGLAVIFGGIFVIRFVAKITRFQQFFGVVAEIKHSKSAM
jgi:hypothetical protein